MLLIRLIAFILFLIQGTHFRRFYILIYIYLFIYLLAESLNKLYCFMHVNLFSSSLPSHIKTTTDAHWIRSHSVLFW